MKSMQLQKPPLTESQIDEIVVAEAGAEEAWGKPTRVRRRAGSLSLPAELMARATFLARLHRSATAEQWLARIIQERIELEETAFAEVSRDLAQRRQPS